MDGEKIHSGLASIRRAFSHMRWVPLVLIGGVLVNVITDGTRGVYWSRQITSFIVIISVSNQLTALHTLNAVHSLAKVQSRLRLAVLVGGVGLWSNIAFHVVAYADWWPEALAYLGYEILQTTRLLMMIGLWGLSLVLSDLGRLVALEREYPKLAINISIATLSAFWTYLLVFGPVTRDAPGVYHALAISSLGAWYVVMTQLAAHTSALMQCSDAPLFSS